MLISCMAQPLTMKRRGYFSGRGGGSVSLIPVLLLCLLSAFFLPGACVALPADGNATSGFIGGDSAASENLTAAFFYSGHCIACTKALPVIVDLAAEYPSVAFVWYPVQNSTENESLFFSYGEAYGNSYPRYPAVFLSDGSFFEGYGAISADLPLHLASLAGAPAVGAGAANPVPIPSVNLSVSSDYPPLPPVGVVVAAGLIDGINPCAIAVLIFLILALTGAGGRMQMIRFGAAYVAGIYLMYFLSGFGILAVVRAAGLSWYFSCAAGVIAILLGVVMVVDSFRGGGDAHFTVSSSYLPAIRRMAARGGLISVFLAGIVVALIELPCTGGVYLAILAMLSGSEFRAAAGLLALYNLMFVLPLLAIIVAAASGFPPERVAGMRLKYRQLLRRAGGCMLVLLGAGVLLWFLVSF